MIYFCADDYGLCSSASAHIKQCVDEGILNKVSVFPNIDCVDLNKISENKDIRISLHLNLVEGKCMACSDELRLIADKNGNFKHTFGGLFKLWLFNGKEFESQIYKEIKTQVLFWKSILPKDAPFCIDSHQHTHMIPAVFNTLVRVLNEENINTKYIRIPAEPLIPYIKTPSLYFTYSPINIIKQWLLNVLWFINKNQAKKHNIHASYFFGIVFSGKMNEKRVRKVLPKYIKLAEKNNKDIEVLFHPGYLCNNESELKDKNLLFNNFYLSNNRKIEFDTVINYRKEVHFNALH